ncbi:MAG: U32 family peptidase [Kiritimatiellae bacterium]|nr:U32 family peptidase [Kiritimatiellia bacterium]
MFARKPELLAPAGSYEAGCAALQYGADAIYLGLPRFSARAEAVNLTTDDFARIVTYAHALTPRRAVYVTLNTLVPDGELPELLQALDAVVLAQADGIILQDLAVYRLARRHFPDLRLHASTQMGVHNLEGALELAELGFKRVVLARELTLEDIARIAAKAPIEVEVFVHGALCYSYSGMCLFSAIQAGRSGNRGRCAYCCRETFQADGAVTPAYPFSMRDLALLDSLAPLAEAGVASLKIEGRMKSPLYVAAVTDLYRRKLDGRLDADAENESVANVQTVFSRPWTELYLHGGQQPPEAVIDAQAVGHRGAPIGIAEDVRRDRQGRRWLRFQTQRALEKHDGIQVELPAGGRPYGFAVEALRPGGSRGTLVAVPAGSTVEVPLPDDAPAIPSGSSLFCASSQAVQRRFSVSLPRPADCRPAYALGVEASLSAHAIALRAIPMEWPDCAVTLNEPARLDAARQPGQTAAAIRNAFERLGGSRWQLASLDVRDPESRYAPPALLNRLRRDLLERLDRTVDAHLESQRAARLQALPRLAEVAPTEIDSVRWSFKVGVTTEPKPFPGAHEIVLALGVEQCRDIPELTATLSRWRQTLPQQNLRLALPLIVRGEAESGAVANAADHLLKMGWRAWEVADLAGLRLLRRLACEPISLTADGAFYTLNRVAREQLAELGIAGAVAPAEADLETLAALARVPQPTLIVAVYQNPPLFISDTRPVTPRRVQSGNVLRFTGRRGERFITRLEDGRWITRAASPLSLMPQLPTLLAAGVTELRVDLTGLPDGPEPAPAADYFIRWSHP